MPSKEVLSHPKFRILCKKLNYSARYLEENDLITLIKIFTYLKTPAKTEIYLTLLNLVRHNINDLKLDQITLLEFLLRKVNKEPLVNALQMALPMVFQVQLLTQMDHDNVPQLLQLLKFISINITSISRKSVMNVVTALTLHGESFHPLDAIKIVNALSEFDHFLPGYRRLLNNTVTVVGENMHEVEFRHLEFTLQQMIDVFATLKHPEFYNDQFFAKCAEEAISRDIGFQTAIHVLQKFGQIVSLWERVIF